MSQRRSAAGARSAPRRPFTPRVTPMAERVDEAGAHLEFTVEAEPQEEEPRSSTPPRPLAIVRVVPVAPSRGPDARSVAQSSRRILWLVAVLAACAPLAWIALRNSESASAPPAAAASLAPPAALPKAPIVLAAATQSVPIQTVSALISGKPTEAPPPRNADRASRVERSRKLPRSDANTSEAATATASGAFYGALAVDSEPSGARVFVNGAPAGSTPLILEGVPVGSRVVRVEADAYAPWSSAVRVVANEQTRISATLTRTSAP
jgi:PEGA domain